MKFYSIIILSIILSSCFTSLPNNQYFNYNEVNHYYLNDINERSLKEINKREPKTESEKAMLDLYLGKNELNLKDSIKILDAIQSINYSEQKISFKNSQKLKKIFRDRQMRERYDYMCFREYRDILIFKHNDTIVGMAFICFKCDQAEIVGTEVNTLDFGQKGNYKKLHEILYEEQ